ncbi:MAG: vWA domain-containing protein, partial [Egibacteraceae bacterium]
RGHHVGDRLPAGRVRDVALAATIRAAAASGRRGRPDRDDLREKVREGREGNLVLFVVDASGSMAARRRMSAVKGAVASLLLDAYQRRDRIGLITFRGTQAQVPLPPTSSVERAVRLLDELPTGGRTPIAAGLERAAQILAVERVRDPRRRPLLVLLTDGRVTSGADPATAAAGLAARGLASVVVDTEDGHVRLGLAGAIARALQAPCLRLEELAADSLAGVVRTLTAPRVA